MKTWCILTTDPFLLIWLVKVAVMAASGCTPSTTSCCQGPRLTTDTLLLDPSPSPVQEHSKQHTNKIAAVKPSLKALCIIDLWSNVEIPDSALTHLTLPNYGRGEEGSGTQTIHWVGTRMGNSPTPRNYHPVHWKGSG